MRNLLLLSFCLLATTTTMVSSFVVSLQTTMTPPPSSNVAIMRKSHVTDSKCRIFATNEDTTEQITKEETNSDYTTQTTKVNVTFPSYLNLMNLDVGEYVTSEPFVCGSSKFCVKLYPRGGGHGNKKTKSLFPGKKDNNNNEQKSGFGMSYKVLPMFGTPDEKVGIYLQYLPESIDESIDATFGLRLKGRQRIGRKFDVEWRAGMRFVDTEKSNLAQGIANDFGAHLMQTIVLKEFLGITNDNLDDPTPVSVEVEVTLFQSNKENDTTTTMTTKDETMSITTKEKQSNNKESNNNNNNNNENQSFFGSFGEDIRIPTTGGGSGSMDVVHDSERVRVGKIVVPILQRLSQRPRMFEIGAYPGVEYRILRILKDGKERFTSCPGAEYELKPIYPLVQELERPWPVTVSEKEIPKLYTQVMYNTVSALGSLATAVFGLFTAFCISQAISLFFIPSRSMDPTLQVGDVLLVDKVSPRILHKEKVGDVVLFSPPSKLRDIVSANGGKLTDRDLFVKRIAAQPGDAVSIDASGSVRINQQPSPFRRDMCEAEPLRLIEKYVTPKEVVMGSNEVFVMGDCSSVSIDSRVWGPLQSNEIVGRPILRLWPLDRFGQIQALPEAPTVETTIQSANWND